MGIEAGLTASLQGTVNNIRIRLKNGAYSVNTIIKRDKPTGASPAQAAQRDIVTGGIVVAAIIMFVGTGTSVVTSTIEMITGVGGGADNTLTVALLLNIALMLFGWRRYQDLTREVEERKAAEERAQVLALRDPLTGFHNRRSLAENGAE